MDADHPGSGVLIARRSTEKIIADPSAYRASSESDAKIMISQLNWRLDKKDEAIAALNDAIDHHEIDPERGYESHQLLNLAQSILDEMKKAN